LTVNVISPTASKPDLGTPLPAEVQAFVQATIHARASGYLKNWFVDIGDHVTNGQVLAEIDTPELDSAARAGQSRTGPGQRQSLDLAKSPPTAGRICSKPPA
jgi:multidrug efflux pump subunit AcrA (membrane-fusion protein)